MSRETDDQGGERLESAIPERFEVRGRIGSGSQGVTFRADDRETGREVAVKVLELEEVDDWKSVELFERQAEALQNIDHPKVPDYVDATDDLAGERTHLYLAQEYVEGTDWGTLLEQGERLDEPAGRAFVGEMLEIAADLQAFSPPIVHRDIKPSNIMRRPDGSLALIDFGAVRTVLPDREGGSTFVGAGTNGYMAPEQLRGRAGSAADVYAIAATAVHLMGGTHPLELPMSEMKLEFRGELEVSESLAAVLERMLAPDVDERYGDAEAALEALRRDDPTTPRVEGDRLLAYLEEKPDELRAEVRAGPERLTVELPPGEERTSALVSAVVDIVGGFAALVAPFALMVVSQLVEGSMIWLVGIETLILAWLVSTFRPLFEVSGDEDEPQLMSAFQFDPPKRKSLFCTAVAYGAMFPLYLNAPEFFYGPESVFGPFDMEEDAWVALLAPLGGAYAVPPFLLFWAGWLGLSLALRRGLESGLEDLWGELVRIVKLGAQFVYIVPLVVLLILPLAYLDICRRVLAVVAAHVGQAARLLRPSRERLVVDSEFVRRELRSESEESWRESWGIPVEEFRGAEPVPADTRLTDAPRWHLQLRTRSGTYAFGDQSSFAVGGAVEWPSRLWAKRSNDRTDDGGRREFEWLAREIEYYIDGMTSEEAA